MMMNFDVIEPLHSDSLIDRSVPVEGMCHQMAGMHCLS